MKPEDKGGGTNRFGNGRKLPFDAPAEDALMAYGEAALDAPISVVLGDGGYESVSAAAERDRLVRLAQAIEDEGLTLTAELFKRLAYEHV